MREFEPEANEVNDENEDLFSSFMPSAENALNPEYHLRLRRLELEFLEALHKRLPDHTELLEVLGNTYTLSGRFEEGEKMDRRLIALRPLSPLAHYNLACSLARIHRPEEALEELKKAIALGYCDADWMLQDDDLSSLHDDSRFIRLTKFLKEKSKE